MRVAEINVYGVGIYCSTALRCLRLQYHKSNSSVRAAHLNVVALSGREIGRNGSSKEKREGKKRIRHKVEQNDGLSTI